MFVCAVLHLFPSVAGRNLSNLFDDNSARLQAQHTLQAGQTEDCKVFITE